MDSRDDPALAMMTAMAEPNRKRIVELLRDGPLTVGEIADRLGLRQPQASKHLKVLAESGVLEVEAKANRRFYGIKSAPFQALETWAQSFRRVTTERYDKLEAYLAELEGQGPHE